VNSLFGIQLYDKSLRLRRGCRVDFKLTYRCNQNCPYCILAVPGGGRPHSAESTLDEWKGFFERFPARIREVMVCGGETTLIPWMPELVNWLLHERGGYHVTVFSNLRAIQPFLRIKPNHRLQISTTYHHADDAARFTSIYTALCRFGHRVNVDEIDTGETDWKKILPYSRVKTLIRTEDEVRTMDRIVSQFVVAPDRTIYFGCYEEFLSKTTQRMK
jgi:uncharacterized radical SAM superfamily Fe-S cluster-containing enzyme